MPGHSVRPGFAFAGKKLKFSQIYGTDVQQPAVICSLVCTFSMSTPLSFVRFFYPHNNMLSGYSVCSVFLLLVQSSFSTNGKQTIPNFISCTSQSG